MKTRFAFLLLCGIVPGLMSIFAFAGDHPTSQTLSSYETRGEEGDSWIAEGLRFNFRDAPLETVLDYMSRAAGFVIVRDTQISGTVDVVSHKPLSKDESVTLLNTILNEKGYAAIRNDRILTIVDRDEAAQMNIPVRIGREPETIDKTDEMVTQIIPVRYTDAVKLVDNITPLLPDFARISSNQSSNAIVLTDTQSNIRRMVEIIRALDTSISEISTLKVFILEYADAADAAKIINELFEVESTQQRRSSSRTPFFDRMRGDRRDGSSGDTESEARQAASRVKAVADENTNAVVVNAPQDVMPTIEELVRQMDIATESLTEVRVFPLKYADAEEMTEIIANVFEESGGVSQSQSQRNVPRFMRRFMPTRQSQTPQTARKKEETTVVVEADVRTNSLVVNASHDIMIQIETIVRSLDSNPAKEQKVFVYELKNADAETVADLLQEMFEGEGRTAATSTTSSGQTSRSTRSTRNTGTSR